MFGLSFALYRKELGKQVFLLLSFFTILDICLLITTYIGVTALDVGWKLYGESLERFVRISSRIKGKFFFIEISNSYCGRLNVDKNTGLLVSSKTDSAGHGLGLSNIKRFALKYLGEIDINLSEQNDLKAFHLAIMLQGAPPH